MRTLGIKVEMLLESIIIKRGVPIVRLYFGRSNL